MRKVLALRSVPLSKETRDAWHVSGVRFVRRTRTPGQIARIVEGNGYEAILNLGTVGNMGYISDSPVWNPDSVVRAVSKTHRLRQTLDGEGMPPLDDSGPHWHKSGGWGGSGVHYCSKPCGIGGEEVQKHIEGTEYRVITVGDAIVQAMVKEDLEWKNGRHSFTWTWVGVKGVSKNGIIPLLKAAVDAIPNGDRAMLGWDVIANTKPYILECNTSPGVNAATARRILQHMELIDENVLATT